MTSCHLPFNGTDIPSEVKEKMFNPFFTTCVKQHGGSIEVDKEPGEFSEIRLILPRAAALLPE
jgi:two-component system, NtrC family, sensor kinase